MVNIIINNYEWPLLLICVVHTILGPVSSIMLYLHFVKNLVTFILFIMLIYVSMAMKYAKRYENLLVNKNLYKAQKHKYVKMIEKCEHF